MKIHQCVYKPLAQAGFVYRDGEYIHPKAGLRLVRSHPTKRARAIIKVEGFEPDAAQAKVLTKVMKSAQDQHGGCLVFEEVAS